MANAGGVSTLGRAIGPYLRAHGVDTVFGIPGVHNIELYRGLPESGLRHILARHEQGVGFMADGYARASGRPGVCLVISGPGLTNIMTAMGQAYSDSVPLLVISAVVPRAHIGQGHAQLHDMIDQEGAARTVAAWSATADTPAAAFALIDRAFADFASARPRPVHIQIPIDVLSAFVAAAPAPPGLPTRPRPDPAAIAAAAEVLATARRPLMILGGGAIEARGAAQPLAERLGALVLPTIAGKGIVPDEAPCSLGAYMGQPATRELLRQADAVLAVGTELSDTDHYGEALEFGGPLVRIDLDARVFSAPYPGAVAVLGDAAAALSAILTALPAPNGARAWPADLAARHRETVRKAAISASVGHDAALDALRRALPDDACVVTDMTLIAYLGNRIFPVQSPRSWLHPVGFGTLGYGLPAAVGAKLAAPNRPVAALIGDYGFHYTLGELGAAVELGLALPIVLWNNAKLGAIERSMVRNQIAPMAITPRNPDFVALAKAFGAHACAPASLAEFEGAVTAALAADKPTLIEMTPAAA